MPLSRWQMALGGTIALVVMLTLAYCSGVRRGAEDQRLKENAVQIRTSDSVTKLVTSRTDSARKHSDALVTSRAKTRDRIRVVSDTVYVSDSLDVEDAFLIPQVAQLIQQDDSIIAAQQRSLAMQDTLIANLRSGIVLRDIRIDILEHAKRPRIGFKSGVVVGAAAVIGVLYLTRR